MFIASQITTGEDGTQSVFALINGQPLSAGTEHPNFQEILDYLGEDLGQIDPDEVEYFVGLFDLPAVIEARFQALTDRVSVRGGEIYLDGDQVSGPLQDQIVSFMRAGQDFTPLVKFYEKLLTNPLGDVREGLYTWITGQTANGETLTITTEGDLLGYKAFHSRKPEWRTEAEGDVLTPSRRGEGIVNGVEVTKDQYIEQIVGDVVEMPRSRVLHEPSSQCGDGLHIGTWAYASGFQGDTKGLVVFNPRDIVSLPDSNASWKLRVCRYRLIDTVTEPLKDVVFSEPAVKGWDDLPPHDTEDLDLDDDDEDMDDLNDEALDVFDIGDRVIDDDEDRGTVEAIGDDYVRVLLDGGDDHPFPMTYSVEDGEMELGLRLDPDPNKDVPLDSAGNALEVGDRVSHCDLAPPNEGTVADVDGYSVRVQWDKWPDTQPLGAMPGNLTIIDEPESYTLSDGSVWTVGEKIHIAVDECAGHRRGTEMTVASMDFDERKNRGYVPSYLRARPESGVGSGEDALLLLPREVARDEAAKAGDRVVDWEGDEGTVTAEPDGALVVQYDAHGFGQPGISQYSTDGRTGSYRKIHGKGGPTSQTAKGNGKNPAQDAAGRFSNGRPGSNRDSSTGRFS